MLSLLPLVPTRESYHRALKLFFGFRPFSVFGFLHGVIMRSLCCVSLVLFVVFQLTSGQDQSQSKNADSKTPHANTNRGQTSAPEVQVGTPHGTKETGDQQRDTTQEPRPFLTHGEWVMSALTLVYVCSPDSMLGLPIRRSRLLKIRVGTARKKRLRRVISNSRSNLKVPKILPLLHCRVPKPPLMLSVLGFS